MDQRDLLVRVCCLFRDRDLSTRLGEDGDLLLISVFGRWIVVLLTMTPSMLLFRITSAISISWDSSRSGAIFKTIFGALDVNGDGLSSSLAVVTPSRSFSRISLFCKPLVNR